MKSERYLREFAPHHPKANNLGYVYTHILAAEEKLGRPLNPGECVHHIDEDKRNNSLDNLIVFKSNADHAAFHKGVERVQDGDVWYCPNKRIYDKEICPTCKTNYKDAKAKMCISCRDKLNRMFIKNTNMPLPDREVLKEKIRTSSFLQIGREYGVSDNAVRKWCKFYDLPCQASVIKSCSDDEWENECFNNTK
jgi:hypothetical protein